MQPRTSVRGCSWESAKRNPAQQNPAILFPKIEALIVTLLFDRIWVSLDDHQPAVPSEIDGGRTPSLPARLWIAGRKVRLLKAFRKRQFIDFSRRGVDHRPERAWSAKLPVNDDVVARKVRARQLLSITPHIRALGYALSNPGPKHALFPGLKNGRSRGALEHLLHRIVFEVRLPGLGKCRARKEQNSLRRHALNSITSWPAMLT